MAHSVRKGVEGVFIFRGVKEGEEMLSVIELKNIKTILQMLRGPFCFSSHGAQMLYDQAIQSLNREISSLETGER